METSATLVFGKHNKSDDNMAFHFQTLKNKQQKTLHENHHLYFSEVGIEELLQRAKNGDK